MNAKEYLSHAYKLDQRIDCKLEQLGTLKALSTKMTASYGTEGGSGVRQRSTMENAIVKLIDLENEIDNDIDALIDFKKEMVSTLKAVEDPEERLLLELRYLSYKTWEAISQCMEYSYRQVHRIHGEALKSIRVSK